MRRGRGEDGVTSVQLAILMPAVLVWIMLIVQYGLWAHAKQVATAAAAEGVDIGQVADATASDAEEAARAFITQAGNLTQTAVSVDRSAANVTVRVSGRAPQLVPGVAWSVAAVAASPVERFVPQPLR